jgi:hypothetical protein
MLRFVVVNGRSARRRLACRLSLIWGLGLIRVDQDRLGRRRDHWLAVSATYYCSAFSIDDVIVKRNIHTLGATHITPVKFPSVGIIYSSPKAD